VVGRPAYHRPRTSRVLGWRADWARWKSCDRGLGAALITWAISEARRRQCALVQLTTGKSRTSAHRFYERLGFTATHEGMKVLL
jgi:GNAT superfamily N-acetyltransferase